jgi:hypothetical protein
MALETNRTPTWIVCFVIGVVLILAVVIAKSFVSSPDSAEPENWNWETVANADIARTLTKNEIKGCGEMRWRATEGYTQEFVVQCAPKGKFSVEYMVGAASETVKGPFRPGGASK